MNVLVPWSDVQKLVFLSEMRDFGVADCGKVAAAGEKLHDFGAFAGEFGPARGRCGILLESADALAGEFEIDLGEPGFFGVLHGVGIVTEADALFAFD